MVIAALFVIAQNWEQPKCPSRGEGKNELQSTGNEILFGNKND